MNNKMERFISHLSWWLWAEYWGKPQIEATLAKHIRPLPDNYQWLALKLIKRFSEKPDRQTLIKYLINNDNIYQWFQRPGLKYPHCRVFTFGTFKRTRIDNPINLSNSHELANWLGIHIEELTWISDLYRHNEEAPNKVNNYWYSAIAKRSGGNRLIESPKGLLRQAQGKILKDITSHFPIHSSSFGFVKGKSCLDHARIHNNKRILVKLDLENCFQSTNWDQVFQQFIQFGFNHELSKFLTGMSTHRCRIRNRFFNQFTRDQNSLFRHRHLPQGAPTSPSINNAVLFNLDKRLQLLALSCGMNYSRYADDLAFSTNHDFNRVKLVSLIGGICLEEGFKIKHQKTAIITNNKRQALVGLTINKKPNINRDYYDELKAILYNCLHHGANRQNLENRHSFQEYLQGRINFVKTVNSNKGQKLQALFDQVDF